MMAHRRPWIAWLTLPAALEPWIAWLTLPAALACARSRPSRIVAGVDETVVINSTPTASIPIDAFDRARAYASIE